MEIVLAIIAGLGIGVVLGLAVAAKRHSKDSENLMSQSRAALEGAVGNVATQALRENSKEFIDRAKAEFAPLLAKVKELELARDQLEQRRDKDYGSLRTQLDLLATSTQDLGRHSHALTDALRGNSQARGRWGEVALKNIVEAAGMTEHCDFDEQVVVQDGRPDMVIRLPREGRIPVDSKVPIASYLDSLDADVPEARKALLLKHSQGVRAHMLSLSKKDYGGSLPKSTGFTVMFLPSEPALAAAFSDNPGLQEEAMRNGVLIATPVTLVALLRTVAIYWQQESVARDAQVIYDAARELYDRTAVFNGHLSSIGTALSSVVKHWSSAAGSFERMVLPSGRRLEQLRVADNLKQRLKSLDPIDDSPRELGPGARKSADGPQA